MVAAMHYDIIHFTDISLGMSRIFLIKSTSTFFLFFLLNPMGATSGIRS